MLKASYWLWGGSCLFIFVLKK